MRYLLFSMIFALLAGCDEATVSQGTPPVRSGSNQWNNQRLWPVLDAQERRNTEVLCILLKDPAPRVREAAALAFASVKDSLGVPCLIAALKDDLAAVRSNSVFALGHFADHGTWVQVMSIMEAEADSAVRDVLRTAEFRVLQRSGRLTTEMILEGVANGALNDRIRAADALRRLPDNVLIAIRDQIGPLMYTADPEVRQYLLLVQGKIGEHADREMLERTARNGSPMERVNAIRALGALGNTADTLYLSAVMDAVTRTVAMEQLKRIPVLDGRRCLQLAMDTALDVITRIDLIGLAIKHGDKRTIAIADTLPLPELSDGYARAALIEARASLASPSLEELIAMLNSTRTAPEKQAAFKVAVMRIREIMSRSRYADMEAQYAQLRDVMVTAMRSGDEGLIAAAAEELLNEDAGVIALLFSPRVEEDAVAALEPIRDLEARILLEQLAAKRDGLPRPAHRPPPYNHPIDRQRLLALNEGQQYGITTSKGEIRIKTTVNAAPGSSLAFDSLVSAGYYDGKSFHRVVPNFVIQGGCPRGDGFGGMPWTLRTEIGTMPFIEGSLGLASAGPDTEGSQFFITHSAAPHLDGRYTNFGHVTDGMDVVRRIQVGDLIHTIRRLE